jgi:autotransporter-associated beta strand protein
MGIVFTSASAATVINYLGVFDSGGDGLNINHKVGLYLWNGSAFLLQGSVTVSAGASAPLYNGYRWGQLDTPITLSNLNTTAYLVAADNTWASGDNWGYIDYTIADSGIGTLPATAATRWTSSYPLPSTFYSTWSGSACNNANIATDIPGVGLVGCLFPNSTATREAQNASMGVRFTSASADKVINYLGVFDSDGDGLNISHKVGLYELTNGVYTLQGSVTVPAGTAAPLFSGYRWAQLVPPLTLSNLASNRYLVAADNTVGSGDNWGYVNGSLANTSIGMLSDALPAVWTASATLPSVFNITWQENQAFNNANIATAVNKRVLRWDNGASTMNWNTTGTNWTGLTWNNGNPDQAIFGAVGAGTVSLTEPISAGEITFDSAGYTLAGSALTLTGCITVNADAVISNTISSGTLLKGGTGKLTLTATNTYRGETRIRKGTLSVTGSAKLYTYQGYSGGLVYIHPGATLELQSWGSGTGNLGQLGYSRNCVVIDGGTLRYVGTSNSHTYAIDGPGFTIGGNGARLECASAGQTWFINYDNREDFYIQSNGGTLTLTGAGNGQIDKNIPGSGGLSKRGSGTWTLGGANSYSGATEIREGTLAVSGSGCLGSGVYAGSITNSGTLLYSSSVTQTLSGVISGTGTVTQAGSGTLILGGTNTYSGATVVNSGTLKLTQSKGLSSDTAVFLASGAVLNLDFTGMVTVRTLKVGARELSRGTPYDASRLPGVITGGGAIRALEGPPSGTMVRIF